MGDDRESSGSGTVTIVAIILAVVLLVPCCGIVAGAFLWVGTSIQPAPQQAIEMPAEMIQIQDKAVQDKAVQDMVDQAKQMEAISGEADNAGRAFEQAIPSVPGTEAVPAEGEVPSSVDKTPEEEK